MARRRKQDPIDERLERGQAYVQRLQGYRVPTERDYSLAKDLPRWFKAHVARPHQQMGEIAEAWAELLPDAIVNVTRLEGLSRGVLRVTVPTASHHYQLDTHLRGGILQALITRSRAATLRRVKITVRESQARDNGS